MATIKINQDSPFYRSITDEGQYTFVNGKKTPMAMWNLILSIRDCGLYSKGIKPHRNWKISDVKYYFGITGSAAVLKGKLEAIKDLIDKEVANA
jgi:hypothetical protein